MEKGKDREVKIWKETEEITPLFSWNYFLARQLKENRWKAVRNSCEFHLLDLVKNSTRSYFL